MDNCFNGFSTAKKKLKNVKSGLRKALIKKTHIICGHVQKFCPPPVHKKTCFSEHFQTKFFFSIIFKCIILGSASWSHASPAQCGEAGGRDIPVFREYIQLVILYPPSPHVHTQ